MSLTCRVANQTCVKVDPKFPGKVGAGISEQNTCFCFFFAFRRHQLNWPNNDSNDENPGWLGYRDEILPSYIGTIISHYKSIPLTNLYNGMLHGFYKGFDHCSTLVRSMWPGFSIKVHQFMSCCGYRIVALPRYPTIL